jgi:UDP-glucose 4-epimerase
VNIQATTSSQGVALIGAGGFIGTSLACYLKGRVADLRCFGRRQAFPDALKDINWFSGDLGDSQGTALAQAIRGCETVVHLASTSTPANADRDIPADAQANVIASLNLFEHCVAEGVRRLVFLSSGGTVYGIPAVTPIPESAQTRPITAYGAAKLAIEKYLEVYRRQRGLDYTVLRVANAYGPYQTDEKQQGVIAAFVLKALRGEPIEIWGDGSVVRDYIYIEDVAEALMASLAYSGNERVLNIGSGIGTSLLDIAIKIEQSLGVHSQRRFRAGRPADVPVNVLDCMLAQEELGWQSRTSLDIGLRSTVEWLRRYHSQSSFLNSTEALCTRPVA